MPGHYLQVWRKRARQLKTQTYALYLAYRDPQVPWYAKLLAACVVAYALSPIDLIPDFIPVLGYLDDLVLVPLGIVLAIRLIPPDVYAECRLRAAATMEENKPNSWVTLAVRDGDWKLLADKKRQRIELYNITEDRFEINNLTEKNPEKVTKLLAMWDDWNSQLPK